MKSETLTKMFQNRKLRIETKHPRELVVAPILEKESGVSCFLFLRGFCRIL